MAQEFVGVLYDIVEDIVIERSAVIRGSYAEALNDAKGLVKYVNDEAEAFDDSGDANTTVGRVDDSWCFVMVGNEVLFDQPVAA
jgi:hypothetical protein